jgi:SWIM zinc finger
MPRAKTTPSAPLRTSSRKRKQNEIPEPVESAEQTLPTTSEPPIPSSPDPSSPPKKRTKKPKAPIANETPPASPERRPKRYRDRPPQSVLIKRDRVLSQRMFLIERSGRTDNALEEDFSVLGSTGNVYVVKIARVPTCTCPDFEKHQVACKHVLFVFLKVLKVREPLWFQAGFLTEVIYRTQRIVFVCLGLSELESWSLGIGGDLC